MSNRACETAVEALDIAPIMSPRRAGRRVGAEARVPLTRMTRTSDRIDGDAELVERLEQLLRIAVHAECAGCAQLVFAIAAAEKADAEHPRSPCRQQVPDRVAHDVALIGRNAEPLLTGQKEVRFGFGPEDVAALDHDGLRRDPQRLERTVDLRSPA